MAASLFPLEKDRKAPHHGFAVRQSFLPKEINMKARTSMLAFAACAAATLLQPAASFAAQTVSGPLYEDTVVCTGGTNFCDGRFSTYPNLSGKYIRLNLLTCYVTSPYLINNISISNLGGGINGRFQYATTPSKTGTFTFSQPIDFVVAAIPTRYPYISMTNTGGAATGNTLNGTCTLSGLIFTP